MKTTRVLPQGTLNPTAALFAATLVLAFSLQPSAFSQPTSFSYQGRLDTSGQPATGLYDLSFTLYDAITGGNVVGSTVNAFGTPVTNGLFVALLDFGPGAFDGNLRFLEMAVRPTGSTNAFATLAPRQFVSSAPYAMQAGTASALRGTLADAQLSANIPRLNGSNVFTGPVSFSPGSGAGFTVSSTKKIANLNADLLDGLDSTQFWKTGGNLGTGPSTNFLGTLDSSPLELRANNQTVMRLSTDGRVGIGTVAPTVQLEAVSSNRKVGLNWPYGASPWGGILTVSRPDDGSPAGFLGGAATSTNGADDVVLYAQGGGVEMRLASQDQGFGFYKVPDVDTAFGPARPTPLMKITGSGNVGIGTTNPSYKLDVAGTVRATSFEGDGDSHILGIGLAGTNNADTGGIVLSGLQYDNFLYGGNYLHHYGFGFHLFEDPLGPPSPGNNAYISGFFGIDLFTGGLERMRISRNGNVGIGTTSPECAASVVGSYYDPAHLHVGYRDGSGLYFASQADSRHYNWRIASQSFVDGGLEFSHSTTPGTNTWASPSLVIKSDGNVGIGTSSPTFPLMVRGAVGKDMISWGYDAYELGRLGYANDTNSGWVGLRTTNGAWGVYLDAAGGSYLTGGNFGIGTASPSAKLEVAGEAKATVFTATSDRNAKENFAAVDSKAVLEKVSALPITRWNFKDLPGPEHIGPMAQDFYAAFGVGPDDKHIATVDAAGVALAAIQGLNQKLEEEVKAKDARIATLEGRLADLEKLVSTIANKGARQ